MQTLPSSVIPQQFAASLLGWFRKHARELPWRTDRTPYRVWVAEVMLQQTQVDTVVRFYDPFLARFPSIQALANAPLDDVLKAWEGLGYYARARHLHAAARHVVKQYSGALPADVERLLDLPGIGRYIAGAVASLAFGLPVAAIDANAQRVLCRVFGVQDDVTQAGVQRELEGLAARLLPSGEPGAFNEALIELGALVCTPKAPACQLCPLQAACQSYAAGDPEALPVRSPRGRVPHYDVTAAVICEGERILVAQRKPEDMLGGLWEFPGGKCEGGESLPECLAREILEELDLKISVDEQLMVISHSYTHFRMTLHTFWCRVVSGEPRCIDCAAFRWIRPCELDDLPMSVADRKVAQAVQAHHAASGSEHLPPCHTAPPASPALDAGE